MPLKFSVIHRENGVTLHDFETAVTFGTDTCLYVTRAKIQRVFVLPCRLFSSARAQAIEMIGFLEEMKSFNRPTMAEKQLPPW